MFLDKVFANQKLEEAKYAAAIESDKENSSVARLQSNESCSDNVIYKWSHEAILLLIEEYRIRKDDFNSGKISQKKVWDTISKKLIEKGHIVTGPQCMSKFAGLKRTYKATKDHNTKSGNNTRSWVYYELMDDLLGHKPFMQPAATVSSTGLAVASSSKRTRSPSDSLDSSNQESINITPKTKRSNKQAANTNILLEIQKSRQMSEENREKRHQDKIKQRGEAIEIMRQIASSLTKLTDGESE